MIAVQPLPDEYIKGHLGRLRAINGFESSEQLVRQLSEQHRRDCKEEKSAPTHKLIAAMLKTEPEHYLRQHSLLPFTRVVTRKKDETNTFSNFVTARPYAIFQQERPAAYFCQACIKHDKSSMGFSYWRRLHQIPGIDICLKHEVPLYFVKYDYAFEREPHRWRNRAEQTPSELIEISDSPLIRRYIRVAEILLTSEKRAWSHAASTALTIKVKSLGLRISPQGNSDNISDFLKQKLPEAWSKSYLPRLHEKPAGEYLHQIDGICLSQGGSGHVFAIAMAVLFDDETSAVNDLLTSREQRALGTLKDNRLATTRRKLLPIYLKNNGIYLAISKETGLRKNTIHYRFRKIGLPSLAYLNISSRSRLIRYLSDASDEKLDEWSNCVIQLLNKNPNLSTQWDAWQKAGMVPDEEMNMPTTTPSDKINRTLTNISS